MNFRKNSKRRGGAKGRLDFSQKIAIVVSPSVPYEHHCVKMVRMQGWMDDDELLSACFSR